MTTYVKEPTARLDYKTAWGTWLGSGETITDHEITVDTGLSLDSSSATDDEVTVWLDGGSDGERYSVKVLVSTSAGRTDQREFTVAVLDDMATLHALKDRLGKSLTVDDGELLDMLDAAKAEYAEWVGPVGTKTLRYDGGRDSLILPLHSTVTAVAYDDGTVIDTDDLYLDDSGILRWGYGTAGVFTAGVRNVLVTFSVTLPAHHREAILADVAGYFAATQRGGAARPQMGGFDESFTRAEAFLPLALFPRIRALASASIA